MGGPVIAQQLNSYNAKSKLHIRFSVPQFIIYLIFGLFNDATANRKINLVQKAVFIHLTSSCT